MEKNNDPWRFEGFSSPNTTGVPDEYFDFVSPRLNGSEVKVMNYLMRRTYGFKKESDCVSISQMMDGIVKKNGDRLDGGCGVAKGSLISALNSLEKKQLIVRRRQFDFKGGNLATNYQVYRKGMTLGSKPDQGVGTLGSKPDQGGGQDLHQGLVKNSTKPLVQKLTTQDTVNNIQLYNNVNVSNKTKKRNPLHTLNDAQTHPDHIKLIAHDILNVLGDKKSTQFYLLVARKVPEGFIRQTLSELKEGEIESPARVFTSRMMSFATDSHYPNFRHGEQ
jgi:hypothetical protein